MSGDDPTDPSRLLPGEAESMSSSNRQNAEHWLAVYDELCAFKDHLLAEVRQQREGVRDAGQSELESDERLIQREADRLHRRREYWKQVLHSN